MIRSKPSTAEYRDAWERNFWEQATEALQTGMVAPGDDDYEAVVAAARRSHESDCPTRIGDPCRCGVESGR